MKLNRHWWIFSLLVTMLLLTLQFWSAKDVERRTAELHSLLSETQSQAMHLTQKIGYGGLIYHFKNLLLRPDELGNYSNAVEDAREVTLLISDLEENAASMGIVFSLESTRAMVKAYRSRLDEIKRLHRLGNDTATIDKAIRFNDTFAIREIGVLVEELSLAIRQQVAGIKREGTLLNLLSIGGEIVLGALVLALLLNQYNRRRYIETVHQMNRDLELSNARLTTANTSLQQFAGIVSHDLRSPLRHINHFTERVIEDSENPEEVVQHAGVIVGVVTRMDKIIDSLLEFTQTGFTLPILEMIDVSELVHTVVKDLESTIDSTAAVVTINASGQVSADWELLQRVLHNLLGNSLKYTHPDRPPRVEIAARTDGESIEFSVSDNGIGVEARFANRIFEPCQRLHDSQSQYEGTGIGLSLVKAVIEAHGGTIHLDTSYREGTRIVFTLDAAEPASHLKAA